VTRVSFSPLQHQRRGNGFAETAEAACRQRAQVWKGKGLA